MSSARALLTSSSMPRKPPASWVTRTGTPSTPTAGSASSPSPTPTAPQPRDAGRRCGGAIPSGPSPMPARASAAQAGPGSPTPRPSRTRTRAIPAGQRPGTTPERTGTGVARAGSRVGRHPAHRRADHQGGPSGNCRAYISGLRFLHRFLQHDLRVFRTPPAGSIGGPRWPRYMKSRAEAARLSYRSKPRARSGYPVTLAERP